MFHPDVTYQLAKFEHQQRIRDAAQSREARAARQGHHHNWLVALTTRLRPAHAPQSGVQVREGGGRVSAGASVRIRPFDEVACA